MALEHLEGRTVVRPTARAEAEEPQITKRRARAGDTASLESVFITTEDKSGARRAYRDLTSDVVARHHKKSHVLWTVEHVVKWLCGLWAFGLGFRFTIELLASEGWIHMPKHPLNIWFDFFPLCILGLLVVLFEVRAFIAVAAHTDQQVSEEVVQV